MSKENKIQQGNMRREFRLAKSSLSNLSYERKKELALNLGIPEEGSGLPGAWTAEDAKRVLKVPFTDESVDRHGTVILSKGWNFDEYMRNPVVLLGHEGNIPIGTTLQINGSRITGRDGETRKGFTAHVLFSKDDLNPMGEAVYRNWVAGRLRGSSVGFSALEVREPTNAERKKLKLDGDYESAWVIARAELGEISAVSVPSNSSAIMRSDVMEEVRSMVQGAREFGYMSKNDLIDLYGMELLDESTKGEFRNYTLPEKRAELTDDEVMDAGGEIGNMIDGALEKLGFEAPVEEIEEAPAVEEEKSADLDGRHVSSVTEDDEHIIVKFKKSDEDYGYDDDEEVEEERMTEKQATSVMDDAIKDLRSTEEVHTFDGGESIVESQISSVEESRTSSDAEVISADLSDEIIRLSNVVFHEKLEDELKRENEYEALVKEIKLLRQEVSAIRNISSVSEPNDSMSDSAFKEQGLYDSILDLKKSINPNSAEKAGE